MNGVETQDDGAVVDVETPPPVALEETNGKPKKRLKFKEDDVPTTLAPAESKRVPPSEESAPLRQIRIDADSTVRDIVQQLGTSGGYKINVARTQPKMFRDPRTGDMVNVAGHLQSYEEPIDEEMIGNHWGGGEFEIKFNIRNAKGNWQWLTSRRMVVAGQPRTDVLRNSAPPQEHAPQAPQQEPTSLVNKTFEILTTQLKSAQEEARAPRSDNGGTEAARMMVAALEKQLEHAHSTITKLSDDLQTMRTTKPERDPIQEKIFTNLLEQESARITHLRGSHESELRQLKEQHSFEVKRLEDRADRDRSELRQSFERERQTLTVAHDNATTAYKTSYETQIKILENQIRQLEREIDALRKDNTDLRAKREKTVPEMAKELQAVKDVLDMGGDDDKSSFADKIGDMVTNPEALAAIGNLIRPQKGQAPGQPATGRPVQPVQPQIPPNAVVRAPDGKTFKIHPSGNLLPMRPKTKEEKGLPELKEETVRVAINFLERAFEGQKDPAEVAQSARTLVPADIVMAIRDHGVDTFMTKIAKIPMNSPLSSQEARNWVRKFGAALVG